ncbi:hypothetical protein BD769DRAFT_1390380 [Suillus cothurnatus]|nr:hypothetical protein BD769DRAFT_1390380 [Suillus cothurnatus]
MSHIEGSALYIEGSVSYIEGQSQDDLESGTPHIEAQSEAIVTAEQLHKVVAQQRQGIAQLEELLESLESGHAAKEKQTDYFMAHGRVVRCVVMLFNNVEDLINKNNRRYECSDEDHTLDQDRLQIGYTTLVNTLLWFHKKGSEMEYDDFGRVLMLPEETIPQNSRVLLLNRLLCPAELDWNNLDVRTGIQDHSEGHIVTELSFPSFLYDKYTMKLDDLGEGLFKGRILIQPSLCITPSSAKEVEGNGNSADVIRDNRRASRSFTGIKVQFALSSVTSWWSINGDFNYVQFWQTIVDFFERAPGQEAQQRVNRLLEWWTRKIFGRSHCDCLGNAEKANMSVNALARQRAQRDDAAFDSP